MGIVEVDPIPRIEGHLGVKLTVNDATGRISSADTHGNLWRGFENFLIGREVNDAITFTQRICGVCPVPHGQSATFAADAVLGYSTGFQTFMVGGQYSPNGLSARSVTVDGETDDRTSVGAGGIPAKAIHIRNLVLSAEFLMSHITHSYHLAAPSYIQGPNIPPWTPYYHNDFYHPALQATGKGTNQAGTLNFDRQGITGSTLPLDVEGFSNDLWSAVIKSYVKALRIRRLTFEAGALFAGRMPMTSCYVAGGVTTDRTENLATKCTKYRDIMEEVGTFIVKEFVPIFLALGALYPNYDNLANATVLNTFYPTLWTAGNQVAAGAPDATNTGFGAGLGNFLSWGAFPQTDGYLGFRRGYIVNTAPGTVNEIAAGVVATSLTEDIAHSRYQGSATLNADGTVNLNTAATVTYPATEARTVPERNGGAVKYSWLKAPRWNNTAMEVGPLARMFVGKFFQNGVALATSVPGYTTYVKTVGADTGLDPAMINADLAVGCVRSGIATLKFNADLSGAPWFLGAGAQDWTVWNQASDATHIDIAALDQATIGLAYGLASAVILGAVADWVYNLKAGLSIMDRLRSRAIESLVLIQMMIGGFTKGATDISWNGTGGWIADLAGATGDTYRQLAAPTVETFGFGASEAPRGALMHMCTIGGNGLIKKYQCIVPTTWNASPKDTGNNPGAMEKAMENVPYNPRTTTATGGAGTAITAAGGVEALRVAQSFDPCIACAVH